MYRDDSGLFQTCDNVAAVQHTAVSAGMSGSGKTWIRIFQISETRTHQSYTVYRVTCTTFPLNYPEKADTVTTWKRWAGFLFFISGENRVDDLKFPVQVPLKVKVKVRTWSGKTQTPTPTQKWNLIYVCTKIGFHFSPPPTNECLENRVLGKSCYYHHDGPQIDQVWSKMTSVWPQDDLRMTWLFSNCPC